MALYGGDDGLDTVRGILRTAALLLRPGGLIVIEHADIQGVAGGEHGVPGVVESFTADSDVAAATGLDPGARVFRDVVDRVDLNGLPRFTLARRTA